MPPYDRVSNERVKRAIRRGWDRASASYQAETRISLDDIHYAPLAPGERELNLLGDIRGKRVLELACGAAQNSIAASKLGARATALDISSLQLGQAQRLVDQERAGVDLLRGDMERLGMFRDGSFDIVMSSFGWEFVPDLSACLSGCHRVLRSDGLLVVCTVHPLTAFEWDDDGGLIVTDYFNSPVEIWGDVGGADGSRAMTFFHTVEEMFTLLASSGFAVERIVEPYPYQRAEMRDRAPYTGDYWETQYERFRRVPFAIVYVGRKA